MRRIFACVIALLMVAAGVWLALEVVAALYALTHAGYDSTLAGIGLVVLGTLLVATTSALLESVKLWRTQ